MVEYAIKLNDTCWLESNYEECSTLHSLFPGAVFRATFKGIDVTEEVIAGIRRQLIK